MLHTRQETIKVKQEVKTKKTKTKTKTHRLCTREKQTWGQDRLGRQRNETERTEKLGIKNTNK